MNITGMELVPVFSTREMGKTCPSDVEKAVSEHVIVFLQTDAGITGLGEMSDINFDPTLDVLKELHDRLEAVLVGESPFDLTAIQVALYEQTWEHQVTCGIDIALHDAIAKALDIPLYQLFGGKVRDRIPFAYPLAPCASVADVESNLGRIEHLQDQGHPTIRYYFGRDLEQDERFLTQLRERWGDAVEINALDASGRFDPDTAIEVINKFAQFKPNLVESPVKGRHNAPIEDFVKVREAVDLPISEHVAENEVAARLAQGGAVDIFNTGPGYVGLTACQKVFGLAEIFGIQALLGSTVELSIGTAARAHLAAAIPNIDYPCYPSGPLVYDEQICHERVNYEEGHIIVPKGPGLGVEIDPDRLRAQTLYS